MSLHEFGHLLVARMFGVKVLRYCIGMGEPFFKRKWRDIEWCLAPLPLGGYVKMLDTREGGEIPEEDLPYAFDLQAPFKKMLIVFAGPATNLLLAILMGWAMFQHWGIERIEPLVGSVLPNTIAERAGFMPDDRILEVNGQPVGEMGDALMGIMLDLDAGDVAIKVERGGAPVDLRIDHDKEADAILMVARSKQHLGVVPQRILKSIGYIQPGSAADKAGFKLGDEVMAVDGVPVNSWHEVTDQVRVRPDDLMKFTVLRNGEEKQVLMRPESIEESKEKGLKGFAGFRGSFDPEFNERILRIERPGLLGSLKKSAEHTADFSWLTLKFIGRLFTGSASVAHLSGPLTIADLAGKTANLGIKAYIEFLVLISISLGVLNLLPIPVLDGGHFFMYLIEWIRGAPLSHEVQIASMKVGWIIMVLMFMVAIFNDITRLSM